MLPPGEVHDLYALGNMSGRNLCSHGNPIQKTETINKILLDSEQLQSVTNSLGMNYCNPLQHHYSIEFLGLKFRMPRRAMAA
eukprot:4775978-Amphidinium_carterae.1